MRSKIVAAIVVVTVANAVRGADLYAWPKYRQIYGPGWLKTIWPTIQAGIVKAFTAEDFARAVRKAFNIRTGQE